MSFPNRLLRSDRFHRIYDTICHLQDRCAKDVDHVDLRTSDKYLAAVLNACLCGCVAVVVVVVAAADFACDDVDCGAGAAAFVVLTNGLVQRFEFFLQ